MTMDGQLSVFAQLGCELNRTSGVY